MDMDIDMELDSGPVSAVPTNASVTGTGISPSEDDLISALKWIRNEYPTIGVARFVPLLKEGRPEWSVSEKRIKRLLQQEGLMVGASGAAADHEEVNSHAAKDQNDAPVKAAKKKSKGKSKGKANETGHGSQEETKLGKWNERGFRYPVCYPSTITLGDAIDLKKWNEIMEIRNIDDIKGKGLFATDRMEEREVICKEEPWILAADWYGSFLYLFYTGCDFR
jgi:hypothetical protein